MKDEIKDWLVSTGFVSIGTYTRFLFGGKKYSKQQKAALLLFGFAVVFILNMTKLEPIYQTSISLVAGLLMPSVIVTLIKTGEKSEEKASDKLAEKADKFIP